MHLIQTAPKHRTRIAAVVLFLALAQPVAACGHSSLEQTMKVTATAYTMREEETKKGNVGLTAWGDQLEPGMKAIAVSRDLIDVGLGHMAEVYIVELDAVYIVRDKMNKRWKNKIDIFMGTDAEAARKWGKRKVTIRWCDTPKE